MAWVETRKIDAGSHHRKLLLGLRLFRSVAHAQWSRVFLSGCGAACLLGGLQQREILASKEFNNSVLLRLADYGAVHPVREEAAGGSASSINDVENLRGGSRDAQAVLIDVEDSG